MRNTQDTSPHPSFTMLDVMRIMHEAERLQKRAARKPRPPKVRYVLLMWDSEGNGYGTGSHPIHTQGEADRLISSFRRSGSGPDSAALWTKDQEKLVKTYEKVVA